ncbi:ribosome small subunit-dependent GTPase A [Bacillus sp. FJAT-42376]|uniref:ribosome small subunit-dependent GTPase A n=1 Tax=Bacillus sp. FJAT-42376 TaxID=2014076 RepID=UPI000F4F900E|nr:ribosome small subunit-dependent GTPase A [Bacillus sp. FJAT-42376]AZB44807.1 ribosome small subunit-dependent GTPase A [Bacillus sp. FJAT-42376]
MTPFFEQAFLPFKADGYEIGRVTLEHKRLYRILTEHGEVLSEVAGKMRFEAGSREDFPAVGDWVVIKPRYQEGKATIHAILPRQSKFSRKSAGNTTEEQIVAANVDTLFIVMALNHDFNIRRLERYLIMAWESGASPVVVLNKADLCEERDERIAEVESVAFGVPVYAISALDADSAAILRSYCARGKTAALVGSSGVGKSTITNQLLGTEHLKTQAAREDDDRGRHTTTYRELLPLETGGCLIDTPGMRELQLWSADEGFQGTFEDIEALALSCRFTDCRHQAEPGCAIQAALEEGVLETERYESYKKLQKELAFLARKEDKKAQAEEKAKWKQISKSMKKHKK